MSIMTNLRKMHAVREENITKAKSIINTLILEIQNISGHIQCLYEDSFLGEGVLGTLTVKDKSAILGAFCYEKRGSTRGVIIIQDACRLRDKIEININRAYLKELSEKDIGVPCVIINQEQSWDIIPLNLEDTVEIYTKVISLWLPKEIMGSTPD